ncbi:Yip1 family protein [Streptomyces sp. SCSIO ZS0520]|uniref:Yip1 family protein n=1 Tax=Streptomyces sp. SCSIO ZS0520 TaxID=2892996 RepID=UPI0021D9A675|nr:Yip1 family protein [Streptomyces sp. SCSIO ZS0520]
MAVFRTGRGRDNRAPHSRPQNPPQQPYGQQAPGGAPYGGPPMSPYPQAQPPYGQQQHGHGQQPGYGQQPPYGGPAQGGHAARQQWPDPGGHGEPEYFGAGHPQGAPDPYAANNPGHTQAFAFGEDPYSQGDTYRAGQMAAPPVGPRLHWKELLPGIVLRPASTFLTMRDYSVWFPALIVTFVYGLLALFGFDGPREDAINATISTAVPSVIITGIAFMIGLFMLGVVTHTLARQFGGDGAWQPTVGLSMLISSLTDAPRLLVAMFFGGDAGFVQLLGWATWLGAGALLTVMVSKSHDLPWPRALGASAIQLIALLSLIKLGTF